MKFCEEGSYGVPPEPRKSKAVDAEATRGKKMHTQNKPGVSIKQEQLDATRANTPGS